MNEQELDARVDWMRRRGIASLHLEDGTQIVLATLQEPAQQEPARPINDERAKHDERERARAERRECWYGGTHTKKLPVDGEIEP